VLEERGSLRIVDLQPLIKRGLLAASRWERLPG
jgi:hypothetical protein